MQEVRPITVFEMARRFKKGPRWAANRIRQMRHIGDGEDLFTTEEWLAEWMAAESIPAQNWPPHGEPLDPLEEAVCARVISLVGRLASEGKIAVMG